MDLVPATGAEMDRYIGYYEPYATSHDALDRDVAIVEEVRGVARSIADGIGLVRRGAFTRTDQRRRDPRPK
jgi:hypothetical protein